MLIRCRDARHLPYMNIPQTQIYISFTLKSRKHIRPLKQNNPLFSFWFSHG